MSIGRPPVVQQPPRGPLAQLAALQQRRDLDRALHLAVQGLQLGPEAGQVEDLAGDQPGGGDLGHRRPGLLVEPEAERRARPVHHVVDDGGGDDLPVQPVVAHPARVALPQRRREVADQDLLQVRVVGQPAGQHLLGRRDLGVGEQDGELGDGQAGARRPPLGDLPVAGQHLQPPPDQPVALQLADVAGVHVEHAGVLGAGGGQGPVLLVVVGQHQRADLVGHLVQQRVAVRLGQRAVADFPIEQDLDVHLVVRGVHAGRVVDEVGVHQAAGQRVLDPRLLGQAQVAALADDLGPQLRRRRSGARRWTGRPRRRWTGRWP